MGLWNLLIDSPWKPLALPGLFKELSWGQVFGNMLFATFMVAVRLLLFAWLATVAWDWGFTFVGFLCGFSALIIAALTLGHCLAEWK